MQIFMSSFMWSLLSDEKSYLVAGSRVYHQFKTPFSPRPARFVKKTKFQRTFLAIKTMNFKTKHPFEKRKEEAERILAKYPQRIPVICEKDPRSRDIPNIDRQKYLVPDDLSVANFMYVIRKRIKIEAEKSIYLFVNNKVMPATAQFISTLYEKYKDEDGFLYITYAGESTFG